MMCGCMHASRRACEAAQGAQRVEGCNARRPRLSKQERCWPAPDRPWRGTHTCQSPGSACVEDTIAAYKAAIHCTCKILTFGTDLLCNKKAPHRAEQLADIVHTSGTALTGALHKVAGRQYAPKSDHAPAAATMSTMMPAITPPRSIATGMTLPEAASDQHNMLANAHP